jgi:hypothetical protein
MGFSFDNVSGYQNFGWRMLTISHDENDVSIFRIEAFSSGEMRWWFVETDD